MQARPGSRCARRTGTRNTRASTAGSSRSSPCRTLSALPLAVVRALPLADQSARDPLEVVVAALRDTPAILVLDNCEQIIDAAASFTDELLLALPQLTVLATSRRPLELDGELVYAVPPLSMEAASERAIRGGVAPRGPSACRRRRLRTRSDGARSPRPSCADPSMGCRSRSSSPRRGCGLSRSRSSRAVSPPGSPSFAAAPAAPSGVSAPCGRWSTGATSCARPSSGNSGARSRCSPARSTSRPLRRSEATRSSDIVDPLDELVAQSVVEADHETGRFRMLETIRGYGRERAEEEGRSPALTRRHLDHFAAVAASSRVDWYGPGQTAVLARLRADRAELQSALTVATSDRHRHRPRPVLRSVLPLGGRRVPPRRTRLGDARARPAGRLRHPPRSGSHQRRLAVPAAGRPRRSGGATRRGGRPAAGGRRSRRTERPRSASRSTAGAAPMRCSPAGRGMPCGEFEASIRAAEECGHPEEALLAQFQLTTALSHLREPEAARAGAGTRSPFAESVGRDLDARARAVVARPRRVRRE